MTPFTIELTDEQRESLIALLKRDIQLDEQRIGNTQARTDERRRCGQDPFLMDQLSAGESQRRLPLLHRLIAELETERITS